MKLHLPNGLKAILLATFAVAPCYSADSLFIDVGSPKSYTYEVSLSGLATDGFTKGLPSVAGVKVYENTNLVLSGDQKVGTLDENGDFFFVEDTDKYTYVGVYKVVNKPKPTETIVGALTQNFQVKGELKITENAQVSLGGHYYAEVTGYGIEKKHAEYTGLIANTVTVAGNDGVLSLNTQTIDVSNFSASSGTVKIHTSNSEGNTSLSIKAPGAAKASDSKQSQFYDTLKVSGTANVTIGKAGGYTNAKDVHCATSFGRLTVIDPVISDGTFYGADDYEIDGIQITQLDDTSKLIVAGRSVSVGGLNIDQQGGEMSISYGTNEYHFLADYGDSVITQSGDNSKLSIGCIKAYNEYYNYVVKALEDSNLDYAIDPSISITQEGKGSIVLSGVQFKNQNTQADSTQHSSITQTGGGVINLNGAYEGATFDIEQKENGGTINLNGTMTAGSVAQTAGTINVAKNASMSADSVSVGGVLEVKNGGTLTAGAIKVTEGGKLVNNGVISNASTAMLAADDDSMLIIVAGGSVENFGTTDKAILVQDGGVLTLGDGASVGAVTMEQGGDISISGTAVTGALTLTGGTITFTEGAMLEITNGMNVTISKAVTIEVKLSDAALEDVMNGVYYDLFKVTEDDTSAVTTVLNGATVSFVSTSNADNRVDAVVQQNGGAVKIETLVPEPTTATLSLLALAALAARRRRK